MQPGAGTPRHPSLKLQSVAAGQDKGKVGASARGPDRPEGSEQWGGGCLSGRARFRGARARSGLNDSPGQPSHLGGEGVSDQT